MRDFASTPSGPALQVREPHRGVEVTLDAYAGYWRHVPHVKRLVIKASPTGPPGRAS